MTQHSKIIGALAVGGLLAACGGGGDSGPRTVFNYQDFNSRVAGESRVAATGLTRTLTDGPADGTEVVLGTLDREPRTISVTVDNAGTITGIYDADNDQWTDGATVVTAYEDLTGNFDFMLPVQISANGESNPYLLGVISRTEDLPTGSGTSTYSGSAMIGAIMSPDGVAPAEFSESSGDLDLEVSFSTSHATAIISSLSGMPFDSVTLQDLQISAGTDATFTFDGGSSIIFLEGGGAFTPQIGDYTTSADGAFFGGDPDGPVEAGGAFAVVGEDGNIWGIFAADRRVNP